MSARAGAAAVALALAACGGGGDAAPDAAVGADAGDEPGCRATDPRAPQTGVFIGPSGLEARLADYIDAAQRSLWLQMYLFTVDELADRVIAAHQRGVEVRVLLDPDHEGNPDVRARLSAAGVPVRDAPAQFEFSHAKYLLLDGERAVIASANFNYGAITEERNYGAVTDDPADVADLAAVFDSDWTQQGFADLDCTRLLVSPVNSRMRLLQLIGGAAQSLEVAVPYITDSSIRTAIIEAHQRGVEVRVLLEEPAEFADNAATLATLANQGISARVAGALSLHAKLLVADGVAFVGSQNLSPTSLTDNREVGLLVTEPGPAGTISAQFEADWAAATPW
jgi:phosphatidylserine/phosphatidylglycerophosphate/cardiolipin synthase-like enzyme